MVDEVRRKRPIGSRVDKILGASAIALASGAGVVGTSDNAEAAIVFSGVVSIVIPNTIDGLYLNVVTGASAVTAAAAPLGWDLNPYSSDPQGANRFSLWGADLIGSSPPTLFETWLNLNTSTVLADGRFNLTPGTAIGPTGNFVTPGNIPNVGLELNLNSSNNFLGFRFQNEAAANQTQFGWLQLQVGANTGDRTIIGYAYENTGAAITAVPEPCALALLATGAAGLFAARRRRKMAVAIEPSAV